MKALPCLLMLLLLMSAASCAAALEGASADVSAAAAKGSAGSGAAVEPATDDVTKYENVGFAMGTVADITIYARGEDTTADITAILADIEERYISWRADGSEIAEINAAAATGKPTEVSDEMRGYIAATLSVAGNSGGAFDPTVGALTRLWDFDGGGGTVPEDGGIRKLMENVGYDRIKLQGGTVSVATGTGIDLGGIGKGIGCDAIQAYLESDEGITGALVNVGGSSTVTYGIKSDGTPWKVAVLDPRDVTGFLGVLELEGVNHISTSGDYEKYFEKDGKRYHHILDPATGYPADSGLIAVTVVSASGAEADALSTACFVLGRDKAAALLEKYGANGIFVDDERKVYVTDGLKDRFELLADGYEVAG
jgi:thiamine biosynthesis lipoprotein